MTFDQRPAAGWYQDPLDPSRQRYWDGASWTDQVQNADPLAGAAGVAGPGPDGTGRRRRMMLSAGLAVAGLLLIATLAALGTRGSDDDQVDGELAASSDEPSSTTTTQAPAADPDELRTRYDDAVEAACSKLKGDITPDSLNPPILNYDWVDEFNEVLDISKSDMVTAIRECAQPAVDKARAEKEAADNAAAEQARREAEAAAAAEQSAIDSAPAIDVDAVVKNPDAGKGTIYRLVALITQMDAATGPCNFRGYWDNTVRAYNFEYEGDNAMFTAEPTVSASSNCPIFDGIDQDDTMTLTVRLQGSFSYDTQIGGNTTVPHFQVLRVDKLVKG